MKERVTLSTISRRSTSFMSASLNSCTSLPCFLKPWSEMRCMKWKLLCFHCTFHVKCELKSHTPHRHKKQSRILLYTWSLGSNSTPSSNTQPNLERRTHLTWLKMIKTYLFLSTKSHFLLFVKFLLIWSWAGIKFRFNSMACWRENYSPLKIWFHYEQGSTKVCENNTFLLVASVVSF